MTIRILEPNPRGHRLYYVRVLAEGLPQDSVEWWTSLKAANSQEAQVHLHDLLSSGSLTYRITDWRKRVRVLKTVDEGYGDIIIIPDGDLWLAAFASLVVQAIFFRRSASYRVLSMRPPMRRFGKPEARAARARRLAKLGLIWLIAQLGRSSHCDVRVLALADAFGFLIENLPNGTIPVRDPVFERKLPTRIDARERMGVSESALVVGLLGVIDSRKNPDLVARACASAFASIEGRLLVVGRIEAASRSALGSSGLSSRELVLHDGYASEERLASAARACDVLALLYQNHESSSGMLSLAAQAGIPVIVPRGSRLAEIAGTGGFAVPTTLSSEEVSRAIVIAIRRRVPLSSAAANSASRLGIDDFVSKLSTHMNGPESRKRL